MHHFIIICEFKLELESGIDQSGSNLTIFRAVLPWNLTDDLEQGKSEGFHSSNGTSNLTQIGFKSSIFQPVWHWNLIDDLKKFKGHLFYITSHFVHHFKPLGECEPELLSRNPQFGSKSVIFCPVWPRSLMDDLKNNRAPLLSRQTDRHCHGIIRLFSKQAYKKVWQEDGRTDRIYHSESCVIAAKKRTVKCLIKDSTNPKTKVIVVFSYSYLWAIHWSQVLSWEWRCSWSSADRRCFNYIWVINNVIANSGVLY